MNSETLTRCGMCRPNAGCSCARVPLFIACSRAHFSKNLGPDYLAALREPEVIADLASLGVHFDADFTDADLGELKETLACEYTTLFTSPGGCPPVESARLTGRLQQEPFHAVQSVYRRCGFELENGRFALFEDQLGRRAELRGRAPRAAGAGGGKRRCGRRKRLDKEIKRFWALHLGLWVRGYASLLERVTVAFILSGDCATLAGFRRRRIGTSRRAG